MSKGATIIAVLSRGPERIKVPTLAKVELSEARKRLTERGLIVGTIDQQFSDTIPAGSVIDSSPKSGVEMRRDATVNLVVSKGGQPVDVPNVLGRYESEARQMLEAAGFKVKVVDVEDQGRYDNLPAGVVVGQDPTSGKLGRGQTVTLQVSKGPELVAVPELFGMTRKEARDALESLGLKAEFDGGGFGGLFGGGGGQVTSQDPPPGTQVPEGSTVRMQLD
jgi:serine/threonine-protein kinase